MPQLDIVTVFYFLCTVDLTLGAGMLLLWYRERRPYFLIWFGAFLFLAIGFLFNALRDTVVPGGRATVLGFTSFTLALAHFHAGLCDLLWIRRWRWLLLSVAPAELVLLFFIRDRDVLCIEIHSAISAVAAAFVVLILLTARNSNPQLGGRPVEPVLPLLLLIATMVFRFLVAHFNQADDYDQIYAKMLAWYVFGIAIAHTGLFESFVMLHAREQDLTLQNASRHFQRLSETDALTGLINRRKFDEVLTTDLALAVHHDQPLSLLLVDIDHFKEFNDRYGHQAGDRCLASVAQALADSARDSIDWVAR